MGETFENEIDLDNVKLGDIVSVYNKNYANFRIITENKTKYIPCWEGEVITLTDKSITICNKFYINRPTYCVYKRWIGKITRE